MKKSEEINMFVTLLPRVNEMIKKSEDHIEFLKNCRQKISSKIWFFEKPDLTFINSALLGETMILQHYKYRLNEYETHISNLQKT